MHSIFAFVFAATTLFAGPVIADVADDPYTWLEEIDGAKALEWARAENARSLPVLEQDPRFAQFRAEARAILTSPSRLPLGEIHRGAVYNFWQDEAHVRGLWRRADIEGYRKGEPRWETLVDFDRLASAEKQNWVAGHIECLRPEYRHCMVELSRGGGDTSTWREFDTTTGQFVPGGFELPEAKSNLAWLDADTLLVGTDWGPHSLTTSGYARTVKAWRRGTPLAGARTLFEGETTDVGVQPFVDHDGGAAQPFIQRAVSFFESDRYYLNGLGPPQKLPLPRNADLQGVLDGRAIFTLREPWTYAARTYPNGAIVAYTLQGGAAELVFAPSESQSIEDVEVGQSGLVVQYLDHVSGHAARMARSSDGQWHVREIALPRNGVVKLVSAGGGTDEALVSFESLTTPPTLYYVAPSNAVDTVMTVPAAYDATDVVVEQRFATSRDGTRIPYFVMAKKAVLVQGNAPTIQYAYGGFLSATLPVYYEDPSRPQHGALAGKLWVSRGGVLVLSNIRGGSEYGPRWHQAGLRENRQKVFDDFIAISEDLIRTGVTSRAKLGALGRSNGGLLMGVITNQRPELYAGVVNGVPLFDMKRYTKLGAGASWIAEYGDPDTADWSYMSKWSPYQNLHGSDVHYPKVFFYTSTKDDRVHPGHARKAAAKMQSLGHDCLFYENMEGGHGGTSNQDQLAYRIALEYTFFAQQLIGSNAPAAPSAAPTTRTQNAPPLSAPESDPVRLGWMVGSPPPADKLIRFADLSFFRFPQTRWSFAHMRQFLATADVWRGDGTVSNLPRALRSDIDALTFQPLGSQQTMTWAQSLDANYTDAIVVLHKGRIVYERYRGVMDPHTPHIAMSVTKSFVGTLGAMLVAEGKLDAQARVTKYVPELEGTAFADATVRQVLDMTTGLDYSENYGDPKADIWRYSVAGGIFPRPANYDGPATLYAYLRTLKKQGEHGQAFAYKSVNTEVLGWMLRRVTGQTLEQLLSERIWSKLGAEEDGYLIVDGEGTAFAAGGFNTVLRDLARFGEMMRLDGRFNGRQVVPKAVVEDIRKGASRDDFAKAGYATLPGWSYHDMWWVAHNAHGAYMARGIHGQAIYVDPKAEMVIARFGSHPLASNVNFDPTSLPAFEALAAHLMR